MYYSLLTRLAENLPAIMITESSAPQEELSERPSEGSVGAVPQGGSRYRSQPDEGSRYLGREG